MVKIRFKITLAENDKILSQDVGIVKTFKEYFINIPILNMPKQSFSTKTHKRKIFIPKTLKQNSDFFAVHVQEDINASIFALKFPNDLKEAEMIRVYKKKSKLFKEDHRSISILPNIFKVYERCLHDQISKYFKTRFSKFQWGFRKGYSAQHYLLAMIKK